MACCTASDILMNQNKPRQPATYVNEATGAGPEGPQIPSYFMGCESTFGLGFTHLKSEFSVATLIMSNWVEIGGSMGQR